MIPDPKTLVDLYHDMWLIRAFEFALEREFKKGNDLCFDLINYGDTADEGAIAIQTAAPVAPERAEAIAAACCIRSENL